MCGIGRIHIDLKVVFSYSHATPSRGPNNAVLFTTHGEKSMEISKCLLNMFCRECAYNVVISLGCVLYFIYDAWGCICSTDLSSLWEQDYVFAIHLLSSSNRMCQPLSLLSHVSLVVSRKWLCHHVCQFLYKPLESCFSIITVQSLICAHNQAWISYWFACIINISLCRVVWGHWVHKMLVMYILPSICLIFSQFVSYLLS